MRTFTAIALALGMLFTVATANAATTHKKHKKHAATAQGDKTATKDTKPAPKEKAPATK
jgi:hypothetical protein